MHMSTQHSWPGWETVGLIGRGSFGAVYKIQRDVLGDIEEAALKIISIPQNEGDIEEMYSDGYDDESITNTFHTHLKSIVSEYSLMRKMNGCTNIVNCDDIRYVQHENGPGWDIYIKMELLTPLTKALPAEFSEKTVVKIAKDMCAALKLCSEYNIIHRDIKPQNIFVSKRGDYKLGDFGIAKTVEKTTGGTKIGTYKYMAPEVYNNQPYNASADLYSLGLVLYWMMNENRMPFIPLPPEKLRAGMDEESRNRRLSGEPLPAPLHGSAQLKRIVMKACAYDPKDRYHSAQEMQADLLLLSSEHTQKSEPKTSQTLDTGIVQKEHGDISTSESNPSKNPNNDSNTVNQKPLSKSEGKAQSPNKSEFTPEENKGAHRNRKGLIVLLSTVLLVGIALLAGHFFMDKSPTRTCAHVWDNADCMTQKTCIACGEISETTGDHHWDAASCMIPETCKVCGDVRGTTTDHIWIAATYITPQTCDICKATSGDSLGKQMADVLRQHLPFATYSMSSKDKVYGYLDAELTQETENWFSPAIDELVITNISEDGSSMEVRYPSKATNSGYRTRWFPVEDVISLAQVAISSGKTDEKVTSYRFNSITNAMENCGFINANQEYTILGECQDGYYAVLYNTKETVINGFDISKKVALIENDHAGNKTSDASLEKQMADVLRQHLPFATYSMSSNDKVYGYEDKELTQKSGKYYFVPAIDELVITDISADGSAVELRYPGKTKNSYRTLWFPMEDVISLAQVAISSGKTDEKVTSYRFNSTTNTMENGGLIDANQEYTILGEGKDGYYAVLYNTEKAVICGLNISEKLALITNEQTTVDHTATNTVTEPVTESTEYTSVYITVFDNTMVLSGNPITTYDGYSPTEESQLMSPNATCQGYTGKHKIKRAVILDKLAPTSTAGWFSEMTDLTEIEGLNKLNMENVTDISYMFYQCENLTSLDNLSSWDTHNVKTMSYVFAYCKALPSVSGLDSWDVSNVESMLEFFRDCNSLTFVGNLGRWDVGNCQNFNAMFGNCFKLDSVGDLSNWDVSSAIDLGYMFDDCQVLKSPGKLDNWDVRNVVYTTYMFCNCKQLTTVGNLNGWDLPNLQDRLHMFTYCSKLDKLPNWY